MRMHPVLVRIRQASILVGLGMFTLATPMARAQVDHSGMIGSYEGTQTCLNCHGKDKLWGDKAAELMQTTHWTWVHTNAGSGQILGKKNVINNYCIALGSNEPRCTSCHAGLGWKDNTFDFNDPTKVDCLVCHDTTATYKKTPTGAGEPDPTVDLTLVAQNVGATSRATCGACHFFGGGGDAVKHGDLDSTMTNPTRAVDVHMGTDGANKQCSYCHSAGEHKMLGSRYTKEHPDSQLCQDCHGQSPHENLETASRLNAHTARVGCQACHVPYFARGGKATKMSWDWSTAGQKNSQGAPFVVNDADGNPLYDTKKGTFTWESNVVPEYVWFNGEVIYTTIDDVIDPAQVVTINQLQGNRTDPKARLVPVKRFTGVQPYDAVSNRLVVPHLYPLNASDTSAYWKSYNWNNALMAGMEAVGRSFSGEVGWVRTEMLWIQNHMVAPKENALACGECHTPRGRIDFQKLGYPEPQATILQNMAGFEIGLLVSTEPRGIQLRWMSTPGHRYQVQYSSNLSDPSAWTDAPNGEHIAGDTPAEMGWADEASGGGEPRFYRVRRFDR